MRSIVSVLALLGSLAGAGCNVLPIPSYFSRNATPAGGERFSSPNAVVILPPAVDVYLESDDRGARSETGSQEAAACIARVLRARLRDSRSELRELSALDGAEFARIGEHVGLCTVVAPLAATGAPISGCEHTLGPGLASLAATTGADAAWIANGEEVGKHVDGESGPRASLGLSLVDLRSGNLLWVAQVSWFDWFHAPSLRSEEDVDRLVERLLDRYAEREASRQALHATAAGGIE